jgi:hypothetical protein
MNRAFGAFSSIFILLGILIISHEEQLLMLIAIAGIWCIFSFILYHATRKYLEVWYCVHSRFKIANLILFIRVCCFLGKPLRSLSKVYPEILSTSFNFGFIDVATPKVFKKFFALYRQNGNASESFS